MRDERGEMFFMSKEIFLSSDLKLIFNLSIANELFSFALTFYFN